MSLNLIGLVAAASTFLGVWLGHVGVRKIEARSPSLWLPMLAALAPGLASEAVAVLSRNLYISGALGILGVTLLWDALEFVRQQKRIQRGHAPANPCNPRHWRLMSQGHTASIDWLARQPLGRPVGPAEARAWTVGKGRAP